MSQTITKKKTQQKPKELITHDEYFGTIAQRCYVLQSTVLEAYNATKKLYDWAIKMRDVDAGVKAYKRSRSYMLREQDRKAFCNAYVKSILDIISNFDDNKVEVRIKGINSYNAELEHDGKLYVAWGKTPESAIKRVKKTTAIELGSGGGDWVSGKNMDSLSEIIEKGME